MTYENVLQWLIDNVPVSQSEDYRDWFNACKQEINTPSLWDSPSFNRMHEKAWSDISRKPVEKAQESFTELGEGELPDKLEVTRRPDIQSSSIETRITYREPLTFREVEGQALPKEQVIDLRDNVRTPTLPRSTEIQAERIVQPTQVKKQNILRRFVRRLFGI